jgi:hypothetical protein
MSEEKLTFNASVSEGGKLIAPYRFNDDVARLFAGKDVTITVERKRKKRSANQNAYYWGVIVHLICEAMNWAGENVTATEVHEFLKFRFLLLQKVDTETGKVIWQRSRSTTGLNTVEFMLYIDSCIQFAAEYLNTVIPPPHTMSGEYTFPEFPEKLETREQYVERIGNYVEMIFDIETLHRYFNQVPEWKNDGAIRALFTDRKLKIRSGELS